MDEISESDEKVTTEGGGSEDVVTKVLAEMEVLKADIAKVEAEKEKLKSQLKSAMMSNDKSTIDLASSREKWRSATAELEEAQEDLEESRQRIAVVSIPHSKQHSG
jgi:chromosome segregation ATPase